MISRSSINGKYATTRIGDVVEFLDSKRRPVTESDRRPGPYPYYGANGIQGTIDEYIFDEPLVLLAEDGGHFGNPDRGIAYSISGKTWVNNHAHVLRPTSAIELAYLCRVLENYDVTPFVTGTTRGKLTKAGASEILIPLPSITEQQHIADILDRADALRAKRRAALAELDSLSQAIFLEMFGDPIKNERNWPIHEMQDFCKVDRGKFTPRPRNDPSYYGGRFPFIQTGDISSSGGRVRSWSQTLNEKGARVSRSFPAGTVVIAIVGATLGITAILDTEVYCPDSVVGIQVNSDKASSEFVERVLRFWRPIFVAQAPETARANINLETIRPLKVPCPPFELQKIYESRIKLVQQLKTYYVQSLCVFDALFASLQHRAFRGEL